MKDNMSDPQESTNITGNRLALRVGSEFFSAILVGLFVGYGIDSLFGTKPWGMVVMILLGFLAGFRNIFKFFSLAQKGADPVHLSQNGENSPGQSLKDLKEDEGNNHG